MSKPFSLMLAELSRTRRPTQQIPPLEAPPRPSLLRAHGAAIVAQMLAGTKQPR